VHHEQKSIEQAKRDRWNDERLHRGVAVGMIMKERLPTLRRWLSSFDYIFGHARLPDIDSGLEQLSLDSAAHPTAEW
jgi:hypothetical protein